MRTPICDELGIEFRLANFGYVHLNDGGWVFLPHHSIQGIRQLVNALAAPADNRSGSRSKDRHLDPVRRALDLDTRDIAKPHAIPDEIPDVMVEHQRIAVALLAIEPVAVPATNDSNAKSYRVYLLTQLLLLLCLVLVLGPGRILFEGGRVLVEGAGWLVGLSLRTGIGSKRFPTVRSISSSYLRIYCQYLFTCRIHCLDRWSLLDDRRGSGRLDLGLLTLRRSSKLGPSLGLRSVRLDQSRRLDIFHHHSNVAALLDNSIRSAHGSRSKPLQPRPLINNNRRNLQCIGREIVVLLSIRDRAHQNLPKLPGAFGRVVAQQVHGMGRALAANLGRYDANLPGLHPNPSC